MTQRSIFVVVPALIPTGPIKGALALCNGLVETMSVTLVYLKPGSGAAAPLHPRVRVVSLAEKLSWRSKRAELVRILREAGGCERVVSISCCLSADFLNAFMRSHATIISHVRGNLPQNYRFDYGWPGLFAAIVHFCILRRFDTVVAISKNMARQLYRFGLRGIKVIGNFVDETALESYPRPHLRLTGATRFLFLATLSPRKRPGLLLRAAHLLKERGIYCHLDMVGEGPMRGTLEEECRRLGIAKRVIFHGHIPEPYNFVQSANYLVLPSQSEGIPRAALEALFFGVPCILREVDGNSEVIVEGINGLLFSKDEELVEVMKDAALSVQNGTAPRGGTLLPPFFRQRENIEKFIALISG